MEHFSTGSDYIEHALTQLAPYLPTRARETVVALCKSRTVSKGDTFIQLGKRNEQEYFLLGGIVRSFLTNREGNEVTLSFYEGPAVLSPFLTRTVAGRSILNFQALTVCRLAALDAAAFEKLIEEDVEVRRFANDVLRGELMQKIRKEIGLAAHTAAERLDQFRQQYPALENTIPHPMIASYLGITNVSLSRLRKKQSP
jgi:CRP-like cAMP-binding protein